MELMNDTKKELIISHIYLADKIAKIKKKNLSYVSYEELQSAAYFGLTQAANKYNPDLNDSFSAFAFYRISGAIKDYLRELSWGTKSNYIKISSLVEIPSCKMSKNNDFFHILINNLTEIQKKVITLYYIEDFKISTIGKILDLHESRISQILSDCKLKIRKEWSSKKSELFI
ncbi:MAG: sigma-70 family RNA polymerase sigma factor [Neisseriaceae bacterium]|nr:MAG: sigma-70 family RNA polymerase sigma factor [Neisseriaceae bacterium]